MENTLKNSNKSYANSKLSKNENLICDRKNDEEYIEKKNLDKNINTLEDTVNENALNNLLLNTKISQKTL